MPKTAKKSRKTGAEPVVEEEVVEEVVAETEEDTAPRKRRGVLTAEELLVEFDSMQKQTSKPYRIAKE